MKYSLYLAILVIAALTGCTTTSVQLSNRTRHLGLTPPSETVTIGEIVYSCVYFDKNQEGWIKEFVPKGQDLENYTNLVGVRYFANLDSPEAYIEAMANQYSKEYPHMKFAAFSTDDMRQWIIDFITYTKTKPGIVEWNYFRAEKADSVPGIIVNQYVVRETFKSSNTEAFKRLDLKSNRPIWLQKLIDTSFDVEPSP